MLWRILRVQSLKLITDPKNEGISFLDPAYFFYRIKEWGGASEAQARVPQVYYPSLSSSLGYIPPPHC